MKGPAAHSTYGVGHEGPQSLLCDSGSEIRLGRRVNTYKTDGNERDGKKCTYL